MNTLRNIAAFAALTFSLVACGGEAANPALGKWDVDLKETMAAAEKVMTSGSPRSPRSSGRWSRG